MVHVVMRILLIILLLLAPAQWGSAQTKPKSALDKAALEAYLRHVELYRGTVTFKIDDVAVFALEEGEYTFHDVFMTARTAKVRLVNRATIRAGKPMAQRPERPLAPWAVLPEHQRAVSGAWRS